jgi:hypothetical protein
MVGATSRGKWSDVCAHLCNLWQVLLIWAADRAVITRPAKRFVQRFYPAFRGAQTGRSITAASASKLSVCISIVIG